MLLNGVILTGFNLVPFGALAYFDAFVPVGAFLLFPLATLSHPFFLLLWCSRVAIARSLAQQSRTAD